ncbi:solute carrier family 15 member 1-like isoform X2 [Saccostrea cucullata]|uniref:solute carrier family 15 member 1-like isoform X2 n=1 Tax=Saccostrea cuccullata TaxID=36930 RepID=UPI002ED108FF
MQNGNTFWIILKMSENASYGTLQNDSSLIKGDKSGGGHGDGKLSGKAWGRVKNIMTRSQKYPNSVFFILGNEFCERFSYYGMRAVLILYLTNWLGFSEDVGTSIFHSFVMLCYFSPLFGAILADGYIGRYKTILIVSLVYATGNLVMALTALPPPEWYGPAIGLILIGLGTGGIKPNVSSFGADQFRADQEKERYTFFSAFYFSINLGSMLSIVLTPILRADVKCFGNECYPLAFGIPAALMILATIIFIAGSSLYKKVPPSGNLIGRVFKCIGYGLCGKIRNCGGPNKKEHWLYYADSKFECEFIREVQILLKVLFMFIPAPLFWALSDQQGSRWTLQAEKLNGDLGVFGTLKPDQMSALNPFLILLLIPIFEKLVYPCCEKCHFLTRPLQRMSAGMVLTVISFIMAGLLQIKIEASLESPLKSTESGVSFYNALHCDINVKMGELSYKIPPYQKSDYKVITAGKYKVDVKSCLPSLSREVSLESLHNIRIFVWSKDSNTTDFKIVEDLHSHPSEGNSKLSVFNDAWPGAQIVVVLSSHQGNISNQSGVLYPSSEQESLPFHTVAPGKYNIYWQSSADGNWTKLNTSITIGQGAVYNLLIARNKTKVVTRLLTSVEVNSVSILWMVPQYFVVTVGEVLFSITGLAFAYSQAPITMKSVVQAAWLMTTAVGSLVVVIVAQVQYFTSQVAEFMFFAALMALATIMFMVMSCFYTYYNTSGQGNGLGDKEELIIEEENEDIPLKDSNHPKNNPASDSTLVISDLLNCPLMLLLNVKVNVFIYVSPQLIIVENIYTCMLYKCDIVLHVFFSVYIVIQIFFLNRIFNKDLHFYVHVSDSRKIKLHLHIGGFTGTYHSFTMVQ